ncbi:MAG: VOC family protein [Candidatus Doudnabacteria bacterium]|nr:VOC family protein [Candidatus Doudnabacteria bacterium]
MANKKPPTRANGKICYMEIPSADIKQSAEFYRQVFGWNIREDTEGNVSFDDTVGEVSGMWVLGRKPSTEQGIVVSIMVDSIESSSKAIIDNGGEIIERTSSRTTLFSDPTGNIFCLYQSSR